LYFSENGYTILTQSVSNQKEEGNIMSEAEMKRKNPCGNDREIDEYLNGTICEPALAEEDLSDIKSPADVNSFEVDAKSEPAEFEDEYAGKVR
jgi:hypothetical protein